jgi:hypothetical protein
MRLPDNKLFAVDMPKGSFCDCGKQAEIQYVITSGKGEAKRLAVEAKKARSIGSSTPGVCCGLCVSEVLKHSSIKWERVTEDTKCLDCGKSLPFGAWAHWHADSGQAICGDCGVHRGWTDKSLASLSVRLAELKADVVSVRKRYKIEVEGLYLLEEKVDLHQLAESYIELEKRINGAIAKLESYLNAVATSEEKCKLMILEKEINELQDLALEISNEFKSRLFLLDRAERNRKMIQKIFETVDADTEEELEKIRQAEAAQVEDKR